MPIINVNRDQLFKTLGKTYTDDEFADLCFDYGLELDEITSEKDQLIKEQGESANVANLSDDVIYKVEIPANRYDLLCIEGLTRALLIFQNKLKIPKYDLADVEASKLIQITNCKETKEIRPHLVCAILRDVKFNKEIYNSFIDLQDKLHQNICRKRNLASIGTHDLDTIQGPFRYTALKPKDIKFIPLNQTKEFNAEELFEFYSTTNNHLKPYLPIIKDLPLYPVIYDKNNVVLSLPPIINGNHSKITLDTKNIFIEVTALDLEKANIVLDTVVTMFSQYCSKPFIVEPVKVINESVNCKTIYPKLEYSKMRFEIDSINQLLGIDIKKDQITSLLSKMGIEAKAQSDSEIEVNIPPTRHDILHKCDLAEDVGIAYGFNNIVKTFPSAVTIGQQLSINKLVDQCRFELARCGYTECLTFTLCSKDDLAEKLNKKFVENSVVELANPKTLEFQVARDTLLPGLLKTLQSNKKMQLPLRLFEIADCVLKDDQTETGARNERRLCCLYYGKSSGFELVHGVLDRIMQVLEIPYSKNKDDKGYYIRGCNNVTYLDKRCAEVLVNGKVIGIIGVLHPQVILNYELNQPCSVLELTIQGHLI